MLFVSRGWGSVREVTALICATTRTKVLYTCWSIIRVIRGKHMFDAAVRKPNILLSAGFPAIPTLDRTTRDGLLSITPERWVWKLRVCHFSNSSIGFLRSNAGWEGLTVDEKSTEKLIALGKKLRERSIFVPPPPPNVRKRTCRAETTQELPMHVLATLRLSLSSTPSAVRSLPRWHKHRPPVFFDFSTDTPIGRAILT